MKPNLTLKLLIVIFSAVAAVVLFEIVLRLTTPKPENLAKLESSPLFIYENNPNTEFSYKSNEFNNYIKINSYGFRDIEFSEAKPGGTYRIAVLGDSHEEALQVDLENTWQKIMARRLSEKLNKNIESYNFGVSGYGTDQNWLSLREKVWQFSPDMVILAFSPNDVGDTYKNNLVRVENDNLKMTSIKERERDNVLGQLVRQTYTYHIIVQAASKSKPGKNLVNYIRTKFLGFAKDERFFLSDAQLVEGPFEVIASQKNPPKEVIDTWKIVKALIYEMNSQAKDNGAQFLITINIPRSQVDSEDWERIRIQYNLNPSESSADEINKVIGEIAKETNIDFYDPRIDALNWVKNNGIIHFPKDSHFNLIGHKFMGEKVADFILRNNLVNFGGL